MIGAGECNRSMNFKNWKSAVKTGIIVLNWKLENSKEFIGKRIRRAISRYYQQVCYHSAASPSANITTSGCFISRHEVLQSLLKSRACGPPRAVSNRFFESKVTFRFETFGEAPNVDNQTLDHKQTAHYCFWIETLDPQQTLNRKQNGWLSIRLLLH